MRPPLLVGAAAIVGLACLVPLLASPPETIVRSVSDDAFYYLGVARHVVEGRGPTYDTITWTTGFHPLWMALLAGGIVSTGGGIHGPVVWTLGIGTFLYLITALPLGGAACTLWGERAGWLASALWLSNPHAVLLVATGMEGSLYAALLAGCLWAAARTARQPERLPWGCTIGLAILVGLTVTSRTDALLLLPLTAAWLLFFFSAPLRSRLARTAVFCLVAVLPFLVWLVWAHDWTGSWIQGSADTKTIWRQTLNADRGVLAATLSIFGTWVVKSVLKVPALKWVLPYVGRLESAVATPRTGSVMLRGLWLFLLLIGSAYAIFLPKLWTWYYVPALVTLTLFAGAGLDLWLRTREARRGRAAARGLFALAVLLIGVESVGYLTVKSSRGRNAWQTDMLEAARWMERELPPDTVAAAWNAGIYGWYSRLRLINLDGLINNEIADMSRTGEKVEGYLIRRRVRVLVDYDETVFTLDPAWRAEHLAPLRHFPVTARGGKPITVWQVR